MHLIAHYLFYFQIGVNYRLSIKALNLLVFFLILQLDFSIYYMCMYYRFKHHYLIYIYMYNVFDNLISI